MRRSTRAISALFAASLQRPVAGNHRVFAALVALSVTLAGMPAVSAEVLPSQVSGPYGQQGTMAPSSLPSSQFTTPSVRPGASGLQLETTPPPANVGGPQNPPIIILNAPSSGAGTSAQPPAPQAQETPQGQEAQQGQNAESQPSQANQAPPPAPVTLFETPGGGEERGLLTTVLTGSVTKLQEYPIDLDTVLRLAKQQSLPIANDVLTTKLQQTVFLRSVSDMLPDVQGTFTQSKFNGIIQVFGNQTTQIVQTRITPQLQATWVLYPGGQQIFQSLAEKRRYTGTKISLEQTTQEQLTTAAVNYYQLLANTVQVENAQINLQEAQSQVALSEGRLKAGVGTKLDLMQARSQRAQREQGLIVAENERNRAEQVLLNQLNLDPSIGLTIPQIVVQPRVLVPLSLSTQDLLAHAEIKNPSLQAALMNIKAVKAESYSQLSRIIPSVTLQTYVNKTGPAWNALGKGTFAGFTIQSNLLENMGTQIPLDFRTKRLQARQLEIQRQELLRNVQSQVINAYLDSKSAAQAILAAQDQLSAAQEAYRLAFGRFRAGLGINLDVLNAQTALVVARSNVVTAILTFNQAQVNMVQALGEATPVTLSKGIQFAANPTLKPSVPPPPPSALPTYSPPTSPISQPPQAVPPASKLSGSSLPAGKSTAPKAP